MKLKELLSVSSPISHNIVRYFDYEKNPIISAPKSIAIKSMGNYEVAYFNCAELIVYLFVKTDRQGNCTKYKVKNKRGTKL